MRWRLVCAVLMAAIPRITLGAVSIDVASVTVHAGDDVALEVALSAGADAVVATENEIHFPDGVSIVSCRANDAIEKDATLFIYLPQGCQRAVDCTGVRALVLSLLDASLIPDGSVLYTCTVRVAADTQPGSEAIECTNPLASTATAAPLETTCPAASLQILSPAAISIVVGGATVAPGQRAIFDVSIEHQSAPVATENDLYFPPQTHVRSCAVNPAINKESSRIALLPRGCTPGVSCTSVRALVFSFDDSSVILSGSVLYSCTVDVDLGTPLGTIVPITCANAGASTADARNLQSDCRDGAITVTDPVISLDLGRTAVAPGERGIFPMYANLLREDVDIVGVQTQLRVNSDTPIAAMNAGTPDCWTDLSNLEQARFTFTPTGCRPGVDCAGVSAAVTRTAANPIRDGALVFQCAIEVADTTAAGSYPIRHVAGLQSAIDASGKPRGALGIDGEIVVRSACIGDCDGDGLVPVSELITGVNVLLERIPLATCAALDRNGDGRVTVDELVAAVADALRGCVP